MAVIFTLHKLVPESQNETNDNINVLYTIGSMTVSIDQSHLAHYDVSL